MSEQARIDSAYADLAHARDDVRAAQSAEVEIQQLRAQSGQQSDVHTRNMIQGVLLTKNRAIMGAFRSLQDAAYKCPLERERILELAHGVDPETSYVVAWEHTVAQIDKLMVEMEPALSSQA